MSRKVYDRAFKMAAVQLVLEENMFVKEVAKELSIHVSTSNMDIFILPEFSVFDAYFLA